MTADEGATRHAASGRRSAYRRLVDAGWRLALRVGYRGLRVYWRVRRPTLHGVYVAVWHDDRILMIQNSYRSYFTFPCGALKRGESHPDAAVRELHEEVGIRATPDRLVRVMDFQSRYGGVVDIVQLFELECREPPAVAIDHREVVWARFESLAEARRRPLPPVVRRYLFERSGGAATAGPEADEAQSGAAPASAPRSEPSQGDPGSRTAT